jgi:hypothetical protein
MGAMSCDNWDFWGNNIASVAMANQVNLLLDSFGLLDKIITYIKNEGFNLNTLISVLTSVVSCFALYLACPFVRSYFGHAMSKVAQYATNDNKVYTRFLKVSLKEAQDLHHKRPLLRQKNLVRGDENCCRLAYQDVENFSEEKVYFSNHPIPRNIRILECYFHLLWMATSYSFIF